MTTRDVRDTRSRVWLVIAIVVAAGIAVIVWANRHPSSITTPRTSPPDVQAQR